GDCEGATSVTCLECLHERGRGGPVTRVVERRLQMALDCIGGPPDMKRLVFVTRRAGEAHRALRQIERVGVKLEHLYVGWEGPKDRVAACSLAEEDRVDT